MNIEALDAEVERHKQRKARWDAIQAARQQVAAALAEPETAADLAAIVQAIIPAEMPVTDPAVFRAHVFRTEICEDLRGFGFEPRFWLDNLLANPAPGTREAKQAKRMAQAQAVLRGTGAIAALVGDRGTGKTTICAQIAITRLWEDWHSRFTERTLHRTTAYRKLTAIVSRLKTLYADFGGINLDALESVRDHLSSVELLVIDELHECADDSKHKDRILTDILDRRYASKRDTLLITNQSAQAFTETINRSILSRLNEHGGIFPCEWESYREKPCQP